MFQRTQRDLAASINLVIDKYWEDSISEEDMVKLINKLYINNEEKFKKNGSYTTVLRQQCGKRRLSVVSKVLQSKEVL
nr:TIGR04540 family protein [Salimicrobium jeotgali]